MVATHWAERYGPPLRRGVLAVVVPSSVVASFAWLFLTYSVPLRSFDVNVLHVFLAVLSTVQAGRLLLVDGTLRRASVVGTLFGLVVALLGLNPGWGCPGMGSCSAALDVTMFAPLGLLLASASAYVDLRERAASETTGRRDGPHL